MGYRLGSSASGDPEVRFYVDESLMGLAKALPILRSDATGCGHRRGEHDILPNTPDPIWIPIVAQRGWIVIGFDKKLRTRPGESNLLLEHRLRVIRLCSKKSLSNWEYLKLLMTHWNSIEEFVADNDGPWFLSVERNFVRSREIVSHAGRGGH